IITSLLFLTDIFPAAIDPTPLSFGLSAPLFALGFFRFGVFNVFPIAAPLIVENLRDAVIVTDEKDRVANINLTAKQWFGLNDDAIASAVFSTLPKPDLFKEKWNSQNPKLKFKIELNGKRVWYEATITRLCRHDQTQIGRVIVFHDITQERNLLEAEFRHSMQIGLLEDVSRKIINSLTEGEILKHAADSIVNHFGYAEAAILLLTKDNDLQMAAFSGAHDFGCNLMVRQEIDKGIVGYTARTRQTYIANDVSKDPYYFSTGEYFGSAIGIPLINEKKLLGVLYIESLKPNAFNANDAQILETLANQISSAMQRARLYEDTREHLQVMSAMQSISRVVSSSLEIDNICESVIKTLGALFGYAYISIYLLENDHLNLYGQVGYSRELAIQKIPVGQGVSGRTIKTKKTQFVRDVTQDPNFLRAASDLTSEICVPLLKDNMILGILNVEGTGESPLAQKDADMLDMLAGPIALAVDNARLHAQVKTTAMTDAVSGLSNRHAFEEILRMEIERATRTNAPLSLIIFDLDSFKIYNDTWGHPAGDERLRAIAGVVRASLRTYDVAARYGGDEFAIILPNTELDGALLFARRLLDVAQADAPQPVEGGPVAGYTLSVGVAAFPEDGGSFESLVLAADHAELIAKRLGKNCIVSAREIKK
ncbi:MAG: diguanylate cyclase, partial [Anaerolineales bacterium]|nr:diguanylate cyclase [Anaerolineales bacterium]